MILFKNDWKRFPRAIADYDTSNDTFLRMVSLYRNMGVENCLWPIALLQPELKGVDPYDENLDEETKVKIGLECKWNIWYFLREVVRIPASSGPVPIQYKSNRGNLALTWSFMNNMDIALIQPRQTGKSVSTDCVMVWVLYIGSVNTKVNMITKDHTLRTANVDRLKKIRDLLPKYIVNKTTKDTDNQTDLTCHHLDNSYVTGVGQTSESSANNLGRGLTSPITQVDEGPFIRYIGTTIPAALASGTAAREEAQLYNRPYGNIFTTTAGKKDDRDGKYMYNLIHGGADWNEVFLDAEDKEDFHKLVKRNCSGRKAIINATFSHRQLGKTDQWLYEAIVATGASGEEADRDFFNIWTSGTQSSPLSVTLNTIVKESELDPVDNEISRDSYILRWYISKEEIERRLRTTHFIVGMDTSDAIGRDSIGIVFTDATDLSVVAAATINETNLIRFAKFLAELLIKYPNAILVPERKSSAQSIIDSLLIHLPRAGIDPFKRIYNLIVDERQDRPKDFSEIQRPLNQRNGAFYDRYKKYFGFNTTGASRELLYGTVLQNAAKEAGHLVRDRTLSSEIRGLVVKNGRIDHSGDSHDDMVISWMMSHWFLTHSKNLDFYGIDTSRALSKVHYEGRELTVEEEYEMEVQQHIKTQIEDIYQELVNTQDEYLRAQYENRLMVLNAKLSGDEADAISIDALITQANEHREQEARRRAMQQRRQLNRRRAPEDMWRYQKPSNITYY